MYGATRLRQLPLEGNDFRSLRQLHLNKINKGRIYRRPIKTTHPVDADVEMSESHSSNLLLFWNQIFVDIILVV